MSELVAGLARLIPYLWVVIFVSIFFRGWLWGPVGVLLAVPLMTVIQVVLKQIPKLHPVYRVIAR